MQENAPASADVLHPATFAGRGVAVPFTTPLLMAARVRPSERSGAELALPNPAGSRGVYVLDWPGTCGLCTPTIHDTVLFKRIAGLPRIDPHTVRSVARDVASEGFAGHAAAAAADAALGHDRQLRVRAHFLLLRALVEQVDVNAQTIALADRTATFDRRVGLVLDRIAMRVALPAATLARGLADIGDGFGPIGIGQDERAALMPRLLDRLEQTSSSLLSWLGADPGNDVGDLGRAMATTMASVASIGAAVLADTRAWASNPMGLLEAWLAHPNESHARSLRCDWLLDGWERVCLLWQAADTDGFRRAALLEMAQLVPVLPLQMTEWVKTQIAPETMDPTCRIVSQNDSWRNGSAAFGLIGRNEALRAMSA